MSKELKLYSINLKDSEVRNLNEFFKEKFDLSFEEMQKAFPLYGYWDNSTVQGVCCPKSKLVRVVDWSLMFDRSGSSNPNYQIGVVCHEYVHAAQYLTKSSILRGPWEVLKDRIKNIFRSQEAKYDAYWMRPMEVEARALAEEFCNRFNYPLSGN